MTLVIDYFYTHISPWAYLGHRAFQEIAEQHGAQIRARPVNLGGVFDASGGVPLGKRHPARQAYRFIELQRWKDKRAVPLTFKPKFFPTNPGLADCCTIALQEAGGNALGFSNEAFKAVWVEDLDIADTEVVRDLLNRIGADAETIMTAAKGDEVGALYSSDQSDAIELGVIGSPCYVLKGEPFWGQDRLDLLADALASGREPYLPL
ncbi:2-hydroxychromene-2-carboxylate isomerase [Roseibium sp.]|uniref:2-hydroxychromene-2-carboxylate isomerase n=1 Tax=Roseibium sp. TaxID=1936156 RepID=UPI003A969DB7